MPDPALTVARPAAAAPSAWPRQLASARPDVVLFAGATAVIALHALVDSFLAPEAGTDAGNHVLRGTATLVAIAAAALIHPRLPAGCRALLALVFGVLALEGAALAIADARAVGARGEDWTGFLLLPVGVVLVGAAAVLLWRSRKPGRFRYLRRAGIAVLAVVGAYWLVTPVAVAILATHRPRAAVESVDLGRPYEQVTVKTSDGLGLAGWYVPSRNGAAVISYPTRTGRLPQARMLARHGYGVLLLDARGYDGSAGDPNLFGWEGAKDVDAAVAWLQKRPDVGDGRIGGIGFSVGGEAMLQAAASNTGIRAVVSEGAGARSVREDLIRGPRGWLAIPEAAVQTAAIAVLSQTAPPPSLKDLVPRIAPRPVFLIYAGRGGGGEELNPDYYAAAVQPKSLWKIDEAAHVGGYAARPQEYERRVVGFFDRALVGHTTGARPELQRLLDDLVTGSSPLAPGVSASVSGPSGTWQGAAGVADRSSGARMEADARVRLESVSKIYTAALILRLVQEGRLRVDDTVSRWLPGLLPYGDRITVRQLLTMQSGLIDNNDFANASETARDTYLARVRDERLRARLLALAALIEKNPAAEISPLWWVRWAAWQPLLFTPGTSSHYSNIGYDVLGLIAASAGGDPLPALFRSRIFQPLGLRATSYDPQGPITGPHARGYGIDPEGRVTDTTDWHFGVGAEGGIVSNAGDTARFLTALMRGELLDSRLLNAMKGDGLWLGGTFSGCGGRAFGWSGGGMGYKTEAWVSGDGSRVAVLLLNARRLSDAQPAADHAAHSALTRLYCAA